jgi:multiple sugar transport system substrate-binding protein
MTEVSEEHGASTPGMSRRQFLYSAGAATSLAALAGTGLSKHLPSNSSLKSAGSSRAVKNRSKTLNALWLGASWGYSAQRLAAEYERQTGVKVNITLLGRAVILSKLSLSVVQQSPIDIFNIDYQFLPQFSTYHQLYPVTQLAEKTGTEVELSDFIPRALAMGEFDGHQGDFNGGGSLYGLPQTIHPMILWYRRDIYEDPVMGSQYHKATGRDLAPPKTMDEWHSQVAFFQGKKFKGQTIYGWADQEAEGYGNVHTWFNFVYSFGADGRQLFKNPTKFLSSPAVAAGTKFWQEMQNYCPPGVSSWVFPQVMAAAAAGQLATVLLWSWAAYEVEQPGSSTKGLWDFTTVPAGPGQTAGVSHLGGWVNVIPRTSANPEDAFAFIAWMQSKQNTARSALFPGNQYGGDPTRFSSYENSSLVTSRIPGTKLLQFNRFPTVLRAMQTAQPRPFAAAYAPWESSFSQSLMSLQLHTGSVESALRSGITSADNLLPTEPAYSPQPLPHLPSPRATVSLSALANRVQAEQRSA